MKILVACESSGRVRDAFGALGHHAVSCDLLPSEAPGPHYCGDVREIIGHGWDLMVAFPPCTYVCASGIHWNTRRPERAAMTETAVGFFRELLAAPIARIAIENPVGVLSSRVRKPDQIIQPWQFGEDASKATCLWLVGLPLLRATGRIAPRWVNGRARWANQTDSGQNRLGLSADRWKERSRTYAGIAAAMAAQWGEAAPIGGQNPQAQAESQAEIEF